MVVAPVPAPAPVATLAAPQYDNWLDAPQTAGDWRYDTDPNETLALFGSTVRGDDVFVIRCDKRTRRVGIARAGAVGDTAATMHIRTETADRMVEVTPLTGSRPLFTTDFLRRNRPASGRDGTEPGAFRHRNGGQTHALPARRMAGSDARDRGLPLKWHYKCENFALGLVNATVMTH